MIRIHKPATPPEILLREGPRLCATHTLDAAAGRVIAFERSVYAAAEVIHTLRAAQHGKCCYCEKRMEKRREADVEHFRPKAEVRQGHDHDMERPGYFWLAYDWTNLYLACKPCNQDHKGILFPLADPHARMRGPGDANNEAPMLIDPGCEDPELHITFDEAEVRSRDGSTRGDRTLRLLELARSDLNELRRHHLEPHRPLVRLAKSLHAGVQRLAEEDVEDICSILANATHASSPFAGMMRSYLRQEFGEDVRMPLTATDLLAYVHGGEFPHATAPCAPPTSLE